MNDFIVPTTTVADTKQIRGLVKERNKLARVINNIHGIANSDPTENARLKVIAKMCKEVFDESVTPS